MPRSIGATAFAAALFFAASSFAQSSDPGPYVIDVRGAMSGTPAGSSFYPPVSAATIAPQRGFGFGTGAHVYLFHLGPSRIGIGADLMRARGSATTEASTAGTSTTSGTIDTVMTVTTLAPQLSFNFGSHDGWSYLSAGYGTTQTRAEVGSPAGSSRTTATRDRRTYTLNLGGGARWFLREHLGVGFDVRFHRLRATLGLPSKQIVGLSVGLSVR